ncbi:hypothetical protein LCGC14_0275320 [marine sediment metagenome]|uniref:NAD-dependent epimerase/dehydratase domain-containing protein n=1 Tax=marine sediment metagenome TaxID=412755 RepID=A0A0F9UEC8_9ZZZZ
MKALVTGVSGFIGGHLAKRLKEEGYWVRGADIAKPRYGPIPCDDFFFGDLRDRATCYIAVDGIDEVYHLAASMGGMGFISSHSASILHDNLLIDTHILEAARTGGVGRFFYSSSACVYPNFKQERTDILGLKEDDAYPADPQDTYGLEKLCMEQLCLSYAEDYGMTTRIARFHNVYGPKGSWNDNAEKVPAALCRKIAEGKRTSWEPRIEIWGDGEQTRSFMLVDDCIEGILRLMRSDYPYPLNLGSDRLVSINELADIIAEIAGVRIQKKHIDGPQGVRGRNSNNDRINEILKWAPSIPLEAGLSVTYRWIEDNVLQESL